MGCRQARFEESTIEDFEAATPFNRTEIYHAFDRFKELYQQFRLQPPANLEDSHHTRGPTDYLDGNGFINPDFSLPAEFLVTHMAELKVNPFARRILDIFIATDNGQMSFLEFLDMVSTFSPKNSVEKKTSHAFQIFDKDQDGLLSREDMYNMLDMITDEPLKENVKKKVVDEIFIEVNKENAEGLNTEDFHYAISRAPDFASAFSFRV
jgi:calcium and integrin-binding protein 1